MSNIGQILNGKIGKLYLGDCLKVLKTFPDNCIDTMITDPPASISFMGRCYHKDTDILTKDGWKNIMDISKKDTIVSLDLLNKNIEFTVINKTFKYRFKGKLCHIKHRSSEQIVTKNHDVLIGSQQNNFRLEKADKLPRVFKLLNQSNPIDNKDNIYRIKDREYDGINFCYFLGLFLGDGYTCNRKGFRDGKLRKDSFFGFSVKKMRKKIAIEKALNSIGIRYSCNKSKDDYYNFYCYNKLLLEYLQILGGAKDKYIPRDVFNLNKESLSKLFEGLMETDGHITNQNQQVFHTTSKRLADDFQQLCLYIGKSCCVLNEHWKSNFKDNITLYRMPVLQQNKLMYLDTSQSPINLINYDDFVYCIELKKNHILYTRYNGKPVWSGNSWDHNKGGKWQWIEWLGEIFKECYRVLKPGAIILVWSIPRTSHYTALAIEEGGFQIYDCIYHLYSTGFPKSQDISKMIDKRLGEKRKIVGISENTRDRSKHDVRSMNPIPNNPITITEPSSDLAKQFDGYKTLGLKPSAECWWLAMKPNEGTYVENIEKWGLAGLNIGNCLIGEPVPPTGSGAYHTYNWNQTDKERYWGGSKGRYPSNVITDGSEEVCSMFPNSKGQLAPSRNDGTSKSQKIYGKMNHTKEVHLPRQENDLSASRFFYKSKPSPTEKSLGCENLFWHKEKWSDNWQLISKEQYELYQKENDELGKKKNIITSGNVHETIKSISLMEYFCNLTSPPTKGIVLDPFGGSGTTAIASLKTGRKFIIIEQEKNYNIISENRIKYWIKTLEEQNHENFKRNVKQTQK